jgi:high-affinity nickel-transport protein
MPLSTLDLAFVSAGILGFRHGFDYDHIAAISDITSMEPSKRSAMRMGLVYILGHAVTLGVLGGAVILFQRSLPRQIDRCAERAVGATLVLLGIYVLGSLLRKKENGLLPRSRAAILISIIQWATWKLQRLFDRGPIEMPTREQEPYNPSIVFLIGVIHGLGAETPSQLLIFLLAANLGGASLGLVGLGVFLAGLITMNLLMTASIVGVLSFSANKPILLKWVVGATATYSVVVGVIFFMGGAALLPALGG